MENPKPCPFCGTEVNLWTSGNENSSKRGATIYCSKCNVTMKIGAVVNSLDWCKNKVVEKWNQRK